MDLEYVISIHESGHVLAAYLLGIPIQFVSLDSNPPQTRYAQDLCEICISKRLMVILGGWAATEVMGLNRELWCKQMEGHDRDLQQAGHMVKEKWGEHSLTPIICATKRALVCLFCDKTCALKTLSFYLRKCRILTCSQIEEILLLFNLEPFAES